MNRLLRSTPVEITTSYGISMEVPPHPVCQRWRRASQAARLMLALSPVAVSRTRHALSQTRVLLPRSQFRQSASIPIAEGHRMQLSGRNLGLGQDRFQALMLVVNIGGGVGDIGAIASLTSLLTRPTEPNIWPRQKRGSDRTPYLLIDGRFPRYDA